MLLLLPQPVSKPFHRSREYRRVFKLLETALGERSTAIHVCGFAAPFGVVPVELDEVYPLSQFESVSSLDSESAGYVGERVGEYVSSGAGGYHSVILHCVEGDLGRRVEEACVRGCGSSGAQLVVSRAEEKPWGKTSLESLVGMVSKALSALGS